MLLPKQPKLQEAIVAITCRRKWVLAGNGDCGCSTSPAVAADNNGLWVVPGPLDLSGNRRSKELDGRQKNAGGQSEVRAQLREGHTNSRRFTVCFAPKHSSDSLKPRPILACLPYQPHFLPSGADECLALAVWLWSYCSRRSNWVGHDKIGSAASCSR